MPTQIDYKNEIKGWGADLDPKNRPAYPKERTPPRLENRPQGKPESQEQNIKLLTSVERPSRALIFGTTVPPVGLSGLIRTAAFKLSENDIRHWMMLLFADRVNMVEGILSDFAHGQVPNIYKEMGLKSEFKHNKKKAIQTVALLSAVVVVGSALLFRPKKDY